MAMLLAGLMRITSVRLGLAGTALLLLYLGCVTRDPGESGGEARWLAGDHHIHSRYSVGWNRDNDPPTPIIGGDAIYPIPMNALMGRRFGLSWTVATDHGGPNHSKVNLERAYPELVLSRELIPEVDPVLGHGVQLPGSRPQQPHHSPRPGRGPAIVRAGVGFRPPRGPSLRRNAGYRTPDDRGHPVDEPSGAQAGADRQPPFALGLGDR